MRISLTFDDGPSPVTEQVLDILLEAQVPASFFLIGQNISKENASLIKRQIAMQCSVECHSWTHRAFTDLSKEDMALEIESTNRLIFEHTQKRPQFFRPPYIAYNEQTFKTVDMPFICGRGVNDWDNAVSVEERVRGVVDNVCDGQIILLHDSSGNEKTVLALKEIIPLLKKKRCSFYTVPNLFKACGVEPKKNVLWTNVLTDGL